MGVAVLNPRDCLKDSLPSRHPKKPSRNPFLSGSNPTRNQQQQQQQQRNRVNTRGSTSRPKNASPSTQSTVEKPPSRDLVMGQVKILRRGEEYTETSGATTSLPPLEIDADQGKGNHRQQPPPPRVSIEGSASNPGSDSKFYAGSFLCVASPPPSSVPMPGFFAKKSTESVHLGNDEATNALLKLLRLDLV